MSINHKKSAKMARYFIDLNMMEDIGNFYILNWAAWAPGLDTNDKWQMWAKAPQPISSDEKIQTKLIPPSIKRRCSEVTKIALHVSTQAALEYQVDYAVFGAQHGELQRCVNLFDYIYNQESLSPMAFAQSVHNTASGLYSIIHKKTHSLNAIAAGEQTFCMSMLDALVWMKLNPNQDVLVTVYDDYFPQEYKDLDIGVNSRYALSLLISLQPPKGSEGQLISCELNTNGLEKKVNLADNDIPQALKFLAWYLSSSTQPWLQTNNFNSFVYKNI